jgi:hypothetical protein
MKKVSLYIMALLSMMFVACDEDFSTEFVPQTSIPESSFPASAVTVTPSVTSINLVDLMAAETEQPIVIGTINLSAELPQNTILKAEVEISDDASFSKSATIEANSLADSKEISVMPSALADAYFNNITKNPAATTLYVRALLYTVTGGSSVAIIGTPGDNYFASQSVAFTPLNKVQISPAYYIVGGPNDWATSAAEKPIKFSHSDADVYEDPIFTVVFDAASEGDTWFAIGDDEACAAIGAGDWSKLFGVVGGNSQATEGQLDFRYKLGADNSFCVPAGPKKIKVTLNMLEYTFKVEAVNVADAYYLIGGPEDWTASASSKSQKFSHSDASVADDPIFTYTLKGTGSDIWFAIGDDEACDAIANNNDWSKLYGTTSGNGENGLSGSLARRSSLSDDGSFKVDGTADFIRITINMAELTYEITPINIASQYYVVGGIQGWSDKDKTCLFTPEEQKNILSYTTKWTGAWDLKIWDAENFGNWDAAWGCAVDGDNSVSGGLINSGAQAISAPSAEFYTFTIDMNNMTYTWTKLDNQAPTEYNNISLIGEFNNWNGDFDLQQVTPHNWYGVFTQESDGQLKYRANHDWTINWGYGEDKDWNVADGFNKIGTNGGGNIWVPAGTYAVYLNDITNSMLIIAQ